jgi:hypothetical protein
MASRRRKATGNWLVCPGGKRVSFSSEDEAREGLHRMRERAHRFGRSPPERYYTCELCGKYHLTRKRPRKIIRSLILEPDDGHAPALVTPEGRFYKIPDAGKLLGLSPGKLRRLIARGTIQEPRPGFVSAEFIGSYSRSGGRPVVSGSQSSRAQYAGGEGAVRSRQQRRSDERSAVRGLHGQPL